MTCARTSCSLCGHERRFEGMCSLECESLCSCETLTSLDLYLYNPSVSFCFFRLLPFNSTALCPNTHLVCSWPLSSVVLLSALAVLKLWHSLVLPWHSLVLPCHSLDHLFFSLQIMAVPPTYVDLGKSARDVFTKGYGKHQAAQTSTCPHRTWPFTPNYLRVKSAPTQTL